MNNTIIDQLDKEVVRIYNAIIDHEKLANETARKLHPSHRLSAKNLLRYLVLRSIDLRHIHDDLSDLGISSMRTAEGYVYKNVSNVLKLLRSLQGHSWQEDPEIEAIGYRQSKLLLQKNAVKLFNRSGEHHDTEIMVTLPDETASDYQLIKSLAEAGMEIARINLSRGDNALWEKMIENIRIVNESTGRDIKIYMDLAGPKVRTGIIEIKDKKKVKDAIPVREGDHLILTKKKKKSRPPKYDKKGTLKRPAIVTVQLPQIIDDLASGDPIYFDDGTIRGEVVSKSADTVTIKIIKAHKAKLGSAKGINLPETKLKLPALTKQDVKMLPFVAKHADIVGYSFVRNPEDVKKLYRHLDHLDVPNLGVVLKIENRESFENLPLILLEGMKREKLGVMVARGDLAVEIGFERISEVQNQILWLCEAAHVPVIWATQVLDHLAKTGIATRAEISDAAISAQAECVMLNKGPYILEAVATLKNVLTKMEAHTSKKKSTLRMLRVATYTLECLKKSAD